MSEEREWVIPARTKVFWIGLIIILLLIVPWYLPKGWIGPMVGAPLWVIWILIVIIVLGLFAIFSIHKLYRPKG